MAVNIYAFSDEADGTLEGQIAALKANSLDGMEIRGVNGKNVADLTPAEAVEIKKGWTGKDSRYGLSVLPSVKSTLKRMTSRHISRSSGEPWILQIFSTPGCSVCFHFIFLTTRHLPISRRKCWNVWADSQSWAGDIP